MHIARRKVVWEGLQAEKENSGRNSPTIRRKRGRPQEFANEVASVVGGGRDAMRCDSNQLRPPPQTQGSIFSKE